MPVCSKETDDVMAASKKRARMLSAHEERLLLDRYLDHGDTAAREELIHAYMPLVMRTAQAFAQRGSASLSDLVQEGVLGLMKAIDHFKRDQGTRISTLANFYIKAELLRYVMDYSGHVRVGTNLPDKKVFMNLRRLVSEIQARNGDRPITDADRAAIAEELKVGVNVIERMEARVFASDVSIAHTDATAEDREDHTITTTGVIAVDGDQDKVDCATDQTRMMERIHDIVQSCYGNHDRDLEIITMRLEGEMNREKYDRLVAKYGITVERIRQIQRGALEKIRDALEEEGITALDDIALSS